MNKELNKSTDSCGNRHRSRTLALQTLYACEMGATPEWQVMLARIAQESSLPAVVINYARDLCTEHYRAAEKIDAIIRQRASNWDIKRMAAIDRNILRLAVTELCYFQQVPAKVVIDEAVELAKAYGTEDSGKFVNGIIDSIHKNMNGFTSVSGKDGSLHGTDACSK